jgi:hypothetical protein
MPIVYDIGPLKAGFVPYWTDAQGPGWGFETLSTGAVGNIKMFESGEKFSARTYLNDAGITDNIKAAAGASLYIWHPMGFIAYSPYLNAVGGSVTNPTFAHYIRAAITPSLGGLDVAVGVQYTIGRQKVDTPAGQIALGAYNQDGTANTVNPSGNSNYLGFDAQVNGTIGIPVMLAVTYGMADTLLSPAGKAQAGVKMDCFTALVNVTLIEDLLNIGGGVRFANLIASDSTGKTSGTAITDNGAIVEAKLNIARNLRLSLTGNLDLNDVTATNKNFSAVAGKSTNKLTVMLFGGF